MTIKATAMSLLLMSAVCATPALANFFSSPGTGTMLNVGSAPNPTPGDLRAIGDSSYAPPRFTSAAEHEFVQPDLVRWEGRMVYGAHDERLGTVLAVDQREKLVELQTRGGVAVSMPTFMLFDRGTRLVAPTVNPADVRDMALSQTGRTVALVLDRRNLGG